MESLKKVEDVVYDMNKTAEALMYKIWALKELRDTTWRDRFIKPSFVEVSSNPVVGWVTVETPEVKPHPSGREGGHMYIKELTELRKRLG